MGDNYEVRGKEEEKPPSEAELERYAALYRVQLSTGESRGLDELQAQIPAWQRNMCEDIRQKIRSQYHAQIALERRSNLISLLAQNPPFTISAQDYEAAKTGKGQKKRYQQFQQFVKRYAIKSAIGVHPFFASLARLLEYQCSGQLERSCVWLLDDAVLMESGGNDWMENVIWILKGVLHFHEAKGASTDDPFVGEAEVMRQWTVSPGLSDPECRRLARIIPTFVMPGRGRGSKAIEHTIVDIESVKEIELPTGMLRLSDTLRDSDYRGTLMERLWNWLLPRWY